MISSFEGAADTPVGGSCWIFYRKMRKKKRKQPKNEPYPFKVSKKSSSTWSTIKRKKKTLKKQNNENKLMHSTTNMGASKSSSSKQKQTSYKKKKLTWSNFLRKNECGITLFLKGLFYFTHVSKVCLILIYFWVYFKLFYF